MYLNVFYTWGTSWKMMCKCNTVLKSLKKKQRRLELKSVGNSVVTTVFFKVQVSFDWMISVRNSIDLNTCIARHHIVHQAVCHKKTIK